MTFPPSNSTALQSYDSIRAVEWLDGNVRLLDQRLLPQQCIYLDYSDSASLALAISTMVVRGAPAIGICAAYAVVLAATARYAASPATWRVDIEQDLAVLAASRPTAVNLFWALDRMRHRIAQLPNELNLDPATSLLAEARLIHQQDLADNRSMGQLGAAVLEGDSSVLTHCNTGSLATGGFGTALGVIRAAYASGKINQVFAGETRPWLQGARLTAWELVQDGIPVTLIADSAAAHLMQQGQVQWVIVGADRIAANGDFANKIGTYGLAVAARFQGIKFMVVAPTSSIDTRLASGDEIAIEMRSPDEVMSLGGQVLAAAGAQAWNPAFDVTPAQLVDVLVTEKGVVMAPTAEKIALLVNGLK